MASLKSLTKPFRSLFRSFKSGSKKIAGALGFTSAAKAIGGLAGSAELTVPPSPTIDTAAQRRDEQDRIRRRRGVLANVFAGSAGGSVPLGTATLLGGS